MLSSCSFRSGSDETVQLLSTIATYEFERAVGLRRIRELNYWSVIARARLWRGFGLLSPGSLLSQCRPYDCPTETVTTRHC